MIKYILKQLKQPSTWRGLTLMITALGVSLSPEQTEGIVTAGLSIAGLLGALLPDNL